MATLFDRTSIKTLDMRNRLVRSATWEGMCAADGRPTERLVNLYGDLAAGGVGLIITGYTFVRPDGKQLPGKMGIHTDDFAEDMRTLTKAVHDRQGKICIQLVHAGGQTDSVNAGCQPLAPSAVKVEQFPEIPREMTVSDIRELVTAFAEAAARAKAWGFDAIQLHGAHGYLINQFLSPLTNRRTDEFGGSIEKRCCFLQETYRAVRQAIGDDFPLMIKLNGSDFVDGGLSVEDAVYTADFLSDWGIDAIEVSGGTPASGEQSPVRLNIAKPDQEAYNLALAIQINEKVDCPVMAVGGFRSYEVAERAVREKGIDYISMARPFIREPDLAGRWQQGNTAPAKCISCNGCFAPGLKKGGIYCVMEAKEQERND